MCSGWLLNGAVLVYKAHDSSATSAARSFLMWKCPGTQMGSSGMWSLHHVSVIVAISAQFSVSISDSSVVFGTTDLMFVFTTTGRSHFSHGTCKLLSPREVTGDLVNVVRRQVVMTGKVLCLWAPARQPRRVGRRSATPASHAALQAALSSRVSLLGCKRCKHSAENGVMRDAYTVLATMVAHDRISLSNVTQVQAEN